jgi:hypothetical protein
MYLVIFVHSKSNYIYVFIEYGQLNEFECHVVCYFPHLDLVSEVFIGSF